MNNLGTMYSHGKGVRRDYGKAMSWYLVSAGRGDARAMYNIGLAHEFGKGVPVSDSDAVTWYKKAAQRGLVDAMTALAWVQATSPDFRVRNGQDAIRWAQAALTRQASSKILSTLAAAYAELGEYRKAVAAIDRAIDYMKREINGADMAQTDRELFGMLRQQGRTEDVVILLERQEYYRNGQPTRD